MDTKLMSSLKLIERTPCDVSGWAKCASTIFTQLIAETPDELVEKRLEGKQHFVRLTTNAKTVLKWI